MVKGSLPAARRSASFWRRTCTCSLSAGAAVFLISSMLSSALRLAVGDSQHLVDHGVAGGQQDLGLIAHGLAQQGVAHGALVADLALEGVGLGAAHDVVFLGVLVLHLDGDVGAHRNAVHAQLALVDDLDVLDHLFQLGDTVLDQALGVLGLVVFAVLGQVAVAAGLFDLL